MNWQEGLVSKWWICQKLSHQPLLMAQGCHFSPSLPISAFPYWTHLGWTTFYASWSKNGSLSILSPNQALGFFSLLFLLMNMCMYFCVPGKSSGHVETSILSQVAPFHMQTDKPSGIRVCYVDKYRYGDMEFLFQNRKLEIQIQTHFSNWKARAKTIRRSVAVGFFVSWIFVRGLTDGLIV